MPPPLPASSSPVATGEVSAATAKTTPAQPGTQSMAPIENLVQDTLSRPKLSKSQISRRT